MNRESADVGREGKGEEEEEGAGGETTRRRGRYLHGDLDLIIFQARRLPNMDLFSSRIRRCFTAFDASSSSCRSQRRHRTVITSDPYVTVCVAGARVCRTRVISNSQNPVWDEHFKIPLAHPPSDIHFYVKDNDLFGADLIGVATVPLHLFSNSPSGISEWFPIIGPNGKPPKPDCALRVEVKFMPCDESRLYHKGIGLDYNAHNTYFPVRHGGKLTLYQDAHVPDGCLPEIELEKEGGGGKEEMVYKQGKCWEEICEAIVEAHHLVYIVGWSVYHKVRLVREGTKRDLRECGEMSFGELLRYKSQEGVRVLLLVWDDKTSHTNFFIRTAGVMQTHDEETRKFFKHSSVNCVLSPRYASSKLSIFKQQVVGTLYTHHQKCVLVDSQASGNNRKITAFIGGLDLCDGRYDTPEHRLFRDLDTVFKDDYHNPTFPAGTRGPRQPWHDMHCKIEGPAAYDVLLNFEQRWKKATKWKEFGRRFKKVTHWRDDALIKLERISWIISPSASVSNDDKKLWASKEEDPENWHIQVFRSIDSGSLKGFPKDVHQAEAQNLVCAKDLVIDKSIQTAYIQAIRCAQRFIYIENQYFIGSSYAWPSYKDAGAENSIPMELALKICSKIRAGERFAVYIVIPMWPEGLPTSASVQEILFWQGETMKTMYEVIANELMSLNLENAHPQEYLNFYCLGSRQELPQEMQDSFHCANGETVADSQKNQRFMVYVHAKGMIVDDEYVLMGSANINQRSMAGSRDTEIAMGAYQPNHTWCNKKRHPRGQVYGYRMSLWAEHLGMLDDLFKEPETLDCVRAVNRIAQDNWSKYMADEFMKLQGHLLAYPVQVDNYGKVSPMQGIESFPDLGGKVLGARSTLPDALTT